MIFSLLQDTTIALERALVHMNQDDPYNAFKDLPSMIFPEKKDEWSSLFPHYTSIHPDFHTVLSGVFSHLQNWYHYSIPLMQQSHSDVELRYWTSYYSQVLKTEKGWCINKTQFLIDTCLAHFEEVIDAVPASPYKGQPYKMITAKSKEWELVPQDLRTHQPGVKSYFYAPDALLLNCTGGSLWLTYIPLNMEVKNRTYLHNWSDKDFPLEVAKRMSAFTDWGKSVDLLRPFDGEFHHERYIRLSVRQAIHDAYNTIFDQCEKEFGTEIERRKTAYGN